MDRWFDIPWIGIQYTMGRGFNITWEEVKIPWVGGSKYHGRGFDIPWVGG